MKLISGEDAARLEACRVALLALNYDKTFALLHIIKKRGEAPQGNTPWCLAIKPILLSLLRFQFLHCLSSTRLLLL